LPSGIRALRTYDLSLEAEARFVQSLSAFCAAIVVVALGSATLRSEAPRKDCAGAD
jgi:hypothetical protein